MSERSTLLTASRFRGLSPCGDGADRFTALRGLRTLADGSLATVDPSLRLTDVDEGGFAAFCADCPGWVADDGTLWYAGEQVNGFSGEACRHSVAVLGGIAVIYPEKKWFDTSNFEIGDLDFVRSSHSATLSVKFSDGTPPTAYYFTNSVEPETPQNGGLWLRRVSYDNDFGVFRYYSSTEEWVAQKELCFRIAFSGVGTGIPTEGTVRVSGTAVDTVLIPGFDGSYTVRSASDGEVLLAGAPSFTILARVCRAVGHSLTLSSVTVERRAPELAFVCRAGDRLWGASDDGGTVCASAEGDPRCWDRALGDWRDAAELTVGTPGPFTGIACLGREPVFFKTSRIFRVRGDRPDNFTVSEREAPGMPDTMNGVSCESGSALYYSSPDGVYRWSGGDAELIPGLPVTSDGVTAMAARPGELWVASDGEIYTLDLASGCVGTRGEAAESMFSFGGGIYYSGSGYVWRYGGGALDGMEPQGERADSGWELTSAQFVPNGDCGCISRGLCVDIESDGTAPVEIYFGWDGEFRRVSTMIFNGRIRREIALPQRCLDVAAYRMTGAGRFRLRSVGVRATRKGGA